MSRPYTYRSGGTRLSPATGSDQTLVGSYDSYAGAERAVDYLSDKRFPVERLTVVGRGLDSVEPVTGRLTPGRAAVQSALPGAVAGALFGWLSGVLGWVSPLISGPLLVLYGAVLGAVVGALLGLAGHAVTGGRRDSGPVAGVRADSYDVLADVDVAEQVAQLLEAPNAPGRGRLSGQTP
ncbi:general stress protein [Planobispora rosea]|uniref:general stress protein n=1 Tax=Planobispora rosea TaxID=35762 RepID=UPI0009FBDE8B|nr:general stress protein [Planobispora rosea]